jgi:hypothetical protein
MIWFINLKSEIWFVNPESEVVHRMAVYYAAPDNVPIPSATGIDKGSLPKFGCHFSGCSGSLTQRVRLSPVYFVTTSLWLGRAHPFLIITV